MKAKYTKIMLAFFGALAFTSCAKENSTSSHFQSKEQPAEIGSMTSEEAIRMAKNAKPHCGDFGGCSESIGLVSVANATSAFVCTGFLIADDIVATNSHCIPPDLKAGNSCRNRIWMSFAPSEHTEKYENQAECANIIYSSALSQEIGAKDFAFFKLATHTGRPKLTISRRGFEDGQFVRVTKIDPDLTRERFRGNIYTTKCKTIFGSTFTNTADRYSSTMTFADCPIIPGNSGSPILDENGAVLGIVQAKLQIAEMESSLKKVDTQLQDGYLALLSMGTNFACINHSLLGATPVECKDHHEAAPQTLKQSDNMLAARLKNYDLIKAPFQWTSREMIRNGARVLAPFPSCIEVHELNISQNREYQYPFYRIKQSVDRYLRPSGELVYAGSDKMQMSWRKRADGLFHFRIYPDSDANHGTFEDNIGPCYHFEEEY